MTVKELIACLNEVEPDTIVVLDDYESSNNDIATAEVSYSL